jgi:hypothetical protein
MSMANQDPSQKRSQHLLKMLGDLYSLKNQIRRVRPTERAIVLSGNLSLPDEGSQSLTAQYLEHGVGAGKSL